MAVAGGTAANQLREITECPICLSAFTDPRMLPCIHTFCLNCLNSTGETSRKRPGDKLPCPMCRKEFKIPREGMTGLQKHFFMEKLMQLKTTLEMGNASIICDKCRARNEGNTAATTKCLECEENYCDSCFNVHQLSRNHNVVKIGSDTTSAKNCSKHTDELLDYYCDDCKKFVCVSCFFDGHKLNDCKDAAKEFRQAIENNAWEISTFADEMTSMRKNMETRRADFLQQVAEKENAIQERNLELINMINEHTSLLFEELYAAKLVHLNELDNEIEEIDRFCTILRSFEFYCAELSSKGSADDIFSSVRELTSRREELKNEHEVFMVRPCQSVEISFEATYIREVLKQFNSNVVGQIRETTTRSGNYAIVVGLSDGTSITKDVIQINMRRPNEILPEQQTPTAMKIEATAAVYRNTVYFTGLGAYADEIWIYNSAIGWIKGVPLVQGRRRHSAAFVDEVLYICGGFADSNKSVLDSVEAYNAVTHKCRTVGKLVHCVQVASNCVPFQSSLYIFGGSDKEFNNFSAVQVYNTKQNTCTLLSKPMPRPYRLMRAVLWETSVILVGRYTCFIYDFETETWQERLQFKTDVAHFGLVLENERIFVIGGGNSEQGEDGKQKWKCRDDVRYIPLRNFIEDKPIEWKIHAKLPQPSVIHAYATVTCFVP